MIYHITEHPNKKAFLLHRADGKEMHKALAGLHYMVPKNTENHPKTRVFATNRFFTIHKIITKELGGKVVIDYAK